MTPTSTHALLGLVLAALGFASPAFGADPPRLAAVDALVQKAVRSSEPGAVVAVARDGEVLHLAAYGLERVGSDTPLTPDSRFLVASTSKAVTAACVARLARDGRISLDDDIRRHLPELPERATPITIRHLLHHRSGLRDFYDVFILARRRLDASIAPKEVIDLACRQKELAFEPGTDALYSNTGYLLLAEIVKRVSGRSLRAYADETLFKPLGMTRTLFRDDSSEAIDGLVPGHDPAPSGLRERRSPPPALVGPGGLVTTARDLLLFDAALRGVLQDMRLDEPPSLRASDRRDPALGHYAFGCLGGSRGGLRLVMSPGGSFGYQTQFLRTPDSGLAVIVLANAAGVRSIELGIEIARSVLGTPSPDPPRGAGPPVAPPPGIHLFRESTAGAGTGDLLVFSSRGETHKLASLGWKATLAPAGGRAFAATDTLIPLSFRWAAGDDGAPASALLEIEGEPARQYEAVPPYRAGASDVAALVGEYESGETSATIRLVEKGGTIAIDDAGLAMTIPPFLFVAKDLLVSDAPARIDVEARDGGGRATVLRVGTGRARKIPFTRKN